MKTTKEIVMLYIMLITQLLIILALIPSDKDIVGVIRAGNTQILSTINQNSCFHLSLPDEDGETK